MFPNHSQRRQNEWQILLEQYPTSPELTASVVMMAVDHDDLGPGRSALDLGCGTGMLMLGCALVDCDFVLGVDCDSDALDIARRNVQEFELENQVSLCLAQLKNQVSKKRAPNKATKGRGRGRCDRGGRGSNPRRCAASSTEIIVSGDDGLPFTSKCVDTVVTNPPFGTKHNAGMDVQFLYTATRLARRAVYSFHKTSTRPYLVKTVKSWGMEVKVVAEMKFNLPQTYKFHKASSVDIEVDLIRVQL